MTKTPKFILIFLAILILIVVGYRYKDYIIDKNYTVLGTVACDPATMENCFFWNCTVEEDPECDTWPYGKVEITANEAPECLFENSCEEFNCADYDSCSVVECSEDTMAYWEGCVSSSELEMEEEVEEVVVEEEIIEEGEMEEESLEAETEEVEETEVGEII